MTVDTKAASNNAPKTAGAAANPWQMAADRLRSTGRTFVVMLGSVAATVAAGIGLTQLGGLQPGTPRFAVAVIGIWLTAGGIITLLALTVGLASASTVSVSELRTKKGSYRHARLLVDKSENGLLAGYGTLDALVAATEDSLAAEVASVATYQRSPTRENLQTQQVQRVVAEWHRARLQRVADAASYLRLRRRFAWAAGGMATAAAAAAAGIVAYAWAVTGVPGEVVVVAPNEQVTVSAPDDAAGRTRFHDLLGCDADRVQGLMLPEDEPTVITLPDATTGCISITVPVRVSQDGQIEADPGGPSTDGGDGDD